MKKLRTTKKCPILTVREVCEDWVRKCDTIHMKEVHNMPKGWGECEVHKLK